MMMLWPQCIVEIILVVVVTTQVSCTPFLYNLPRAITTLATSASASASSPSEALSNIVDLRRREQKAELLQQEKRLVESQEFGDGFDDGFDASNNEASPSLLQKKVNKIINKFRLISTLSTAIHGTAESPVVTGEEELQKEIQQFEKELEGDKNSAEASAPQTFQKVIYPHETYGEPLKVTLEIREAPGNGTGIDDGKTDDEKMAEEMGKLSQIGIFFAELFGSIVGLAYGAAAHFNNISQSSTSPPV